MKELNLEQMERIEGGGWFGCTVGILGVIVGLATMNIVLGVSGVGIAMNEC